MREILHFNSTKERIKYLSGGFEEIQPVEVKEEQPKEAEKVEVAEEKPKKTPAKKKTSKKGKKDGEVQAE